MARKKVFIDIQLNGQQSISELEAALAEINNELRNVEVGSDAFNELGEKARRAQGQLNEINEELAPISSQQRLESFKKLGDGLAGAFQIGGAAALLFGEQTQEQFQKIVGGVGAVVVAIDGFKKVAEAASAENIRALRSLIQGWRATATAATGAGTAMRTALISTGIGALVAGVGLLIANWDRLMSISSDRRLEEEAEKEKELLDIENERLNSAIELARINNNQSEIIRLQNELYKNQIKQIRTVEREARMSAMEQEANARQRKESLQELDDMANDRLISQEKYNRLTDEEKEFWDDHEKTLSKIIRVMGVLHTAGATEWGIRPLAEWIEEGRMEKALNNQIESIDELIRSYEDVLSVNLRIEELNQQATIQPQIEETEKQLTLLENELGVLEAQGNKSIEVGRVQQQIVNENIKLLNLQAQASGNLTDENVTRLNKINLELDGYREILNQLKIRGEYEDEYGNIIDENNINLGLFATNMEKLLTERQTILENAIVLEGNLTAEQQRQLEVLINQRLVLDEQQRQREEKIGNELEALTLSRDLFGSLELIRNSFTDSNIELERRNTFLQLDTDYLQQQVDLLEEVETTLETEIENLEAVEELKRQIIINDIEILNNQNQQLNNQKSEMEMINAVLDSQLASLELDESIAREKYEQAQTEEAKLSALQELFNIEQEIVDVNGNILSNKEAIANIDNELLVNGAEMGDLMGLIETSYTKVKERTAEVNDLLNVQTSNMQKLVDFVSKYGEEIQATQDLIFNSISLVDALFSRVAEKRKQELEQWKEDNVEALNEIRDTEKQLADRKKTLNDLLADAEGRRYDMIKAELAEIAAQEEANAQAEEEYKRKEAEMQHEIDMAEYRAAQFRKAQAIVDIILATALAVTRALPNLLLSGLVGGIGLTQLGIAAAQPLPPKPEAPQLRVGGWLEGDSHAMASQGIPIIAEDQEFVVNKHAARRYGGLLEKLNNSTKPKMAEGGSVGATPNTVDESDLINYNALFSVVDKAIKNNPKFVSVKEVREVERTINVVESRTSIGKNN